MKRAAVAVGNLFMSNESVNFCWSCGKNPQHIMACKGCGHVQAFVAIDYFTLFEITQSFDVNLEELSNRNRSLQTLVHPDRLVNQSSREKLYGMQWSQTLNRAYEVLHTPTERAIYMISQALGDSTNVRERTVHDPQLLMEMYEIQEKIESDVDESTLQKMFDNFKDRLLLMERNLSSALQKKEWDEALSCLNVYQYILKILNRIQQKQEQLGAHP